MEVLHLLVLKVLVHQFNMKQFNHLWLTQIYLYKCYLPQLIRLSNDVETNPGPHQHFNGIRQSYCVPGIFFPFGEKSQLSMCSALKLPLVIKHSEKPFKQLGQPSKLFHISGDGNCLFRAFSYIITGRQIYHATLRERIVEHMKHITEFLVPHINTSLDCYLAKTKMATSGVWGTDIEIFAASSLFSTDIFVYSKFGHNYGWQKFSRTMLDGKEPENSCSIYLNHTDEIHYDVVLDLSVNKVNQQLLSEPSSLQKCNYFNKPKYPSECCSFKTESNKRKNDSQTFSKQNKTERFSKKKISEHPFSRSLAKKPTDEHISFKTPKILEQTKERLNTSAMKKQTHVTRFLSFCLLMKTHKQNCVQLWSFHW